MFKIIFSNDLSYLLSISKRYLHGLTLMHFFFLLLHEIYVNNLIFERTIYFIKLLALQFIGYVVMLLRLEEMVMTLKEKQNGLLVMTILCYLEWIQANMRHGFSNLCLLRQLPPLWVEQLLKELNSWLTLYTLFLSQVRNFVSTVINCCYNYKIGAYFVLVGI